MLSYLVEKGLCLFDIYKFETQYARLIVGQWFWTETYICFRNKSLISLISSIPLPWGSLGHHRWFRNQFSPFSLFSTALWEVANSRPVHSLMLSSHLFFCLPCLLPSFTVPCKMVLARPDEHETWPYHCSLHLFTMVRRSLWGPVACWVLAWTSLLVLRSLYDYELCSILR